MSTAMIMLVQIVGILTVIGVVFQSPQLQRGFSGKPRSLSQPNTYSEQPERSFLSGYRLGLTICIMLSILFLVLLTSPLANQSTMNAVSNLNNLSIPFLITAITITTLNTVGILNLGSIGLQYRIGSVILIAILLSQLGTLGIIFPYSHKVDYQFIMLVALAMCVIAIAERHKNVYLSWIRVGHSFLIGLISTIFPIFSRHYSLPFNAIELLVMLGLIACALPLPKRSITQDLTAKTERPSDAFLTSSPQAQPTAPLLSWFNVNLTLIVSLIVHPEIWLHPNPILVITASCIGIAVIFFLAYRSFRTQHPSDLNPLIQQTVAVMSMTLVIVMTTLLVIQHNVVPKGFAFTVANILVFSFPASAIFALLGYTFARQTDQIQGSVGTLTIAAMIGLMINSFLLAPYHIPIAPWGLRTDLIVWWGVFRALTLALGLALTYHATARSLAFVNLTANPIFPSPASKTRQQFSVLSLVIRFLLPSSSDDRPKVFWYGWSLVIAFAYLVVYSLSLVAWQRWTP